MKASMYVPTPPGLFTSALTLRISKYCDVDIAVRYQSCHRRHRRHRHSAITVERHRRSAYAQDASKTNCVEDVSVTCPPGVSLNPASCVRYDVLCFFFLAVICNVRYVDVTIG